MTFLLLPLFAVACSREREEPIDHAAAAQPPSESSSLAVQTAEVEESRSDGTSRPSSLAAKTAEAEANRSDGTRSLPYFAQLKESRPLLQGHVSGILRVVDGCLVLRSNNQDILPVLYPTATIKDNGSEIVLMDGDTQIPLNVPVRFVGGALPDSTDAKALLTIAPPSSCPRKMALVGDLT